MNWLLLKLNMRILKRNLRFFKFFRKIIQKIFLLLKENTDQHSLLERRRTRIIEEKTLFEQSKADKLAIFGKDVPRLLELIDTNINSFKKRPIGPIGNYIKLKDKKWANPIEFCLKNMIGTFLCDSSEDRKALDEICKTLKIRKPNVITTEYFLNYFY